MASNAAKIREWSTRFERFRRSAKTVSRFCRDEQVSIQAFYYWRDRVQANSRDDLQAKSRDYQSLTNGKAPATGQPAVDSDSAGVRMFIRVGAITIECHAESSSAIEAVLSWATRNQDGRFKQLIGHS
jgi:hypothetical protein